MALRFMDGFDHYASTVNLAHKWTGSAFIGSTPESVTVSSRTGGRAGQFGGGNAWKKLDAQDTWIVGMAMSFQAFPTGTTPMSIIVFVQDGTGSQCQLRVNSTGNLVFVRGNNIATLATSASALLLNTWYYVEAKATVGDSGSYEVRVNGVTWLSDSGVDTQQNATSVTDRIGVGPVVGSPTVTGFYVDDLYICDGTGSTANDFLGDVMVTTLVPTGAGNSTQFTPSTGSNWQNVGELPHNSDTGFNSSNTAGHIDLYAMQDIAATPSAIHGIQWNAVVRKDDAGSYLARRVVRSGGTDYEGADLSMNTTYQVFSELFTSDPATGVAFTKAGVDALQAGIKLQSVT
jgi:hypothetical protein